ncbi:MAG: DUF2203 family protein [Candidatus Brocadiae bacterium]|nr:DUF2203 family protein [Candidatus Brocadiia bacterium]
MKLKEPKVFTLDQAKQTLPLVKSIVSDIIESSQVLKELDEKIPLIKNLSERKKSIFQREFMKKQNLECLQEISCVGCHVKDPKLGIIGYYWDRGDGVIAELTWQNGDEDIYYWNELGKDKLYPLEKKNKKEIS